MSCDDRHISKTTATINLKGPIDVMISPLLLESLQRFIEALTPTLSALHPSAIMDILHFECVQTVKSSNRLKKQESKYQSVEDANVTSTTAKPNSTKTNSNLNTSVQHETLSKAPSNIPMAYLTTGQSNDASTCNIWNRDSSVEPGIPHSNRKIGTSTNNDTEIVAHQSRGGKTSRLQIMLSVAKVSGG